jgi:hypothetical protein
MGLSKIMKKLSNFILGNESRVGLEIRSCFNMIGKNGFGRSGLGILK